MTKELQEILKKIENNHPSFRKYGMDGYDLCNYKLGYSYRKREWLNRCMIDINWAHCEIHPTFAKQAGIQLTREIVRNTGIENIYKIFYCIDLLREFKKYKPIKKDGYIYAESQMYTHQGFPFCFKWKSLLKDKEYIEMSDEVDENSVKFEIVVDYKELPKELIPFASFNWIECLLND